MGPPPPSPWGPIGRMNGDPEAVMELLSCKFPHIMHLQLTTCQNQPNDEEDEDVGLASDYGVDEYDY